MNRLGPRALTFAGWLLTPIVAGAASFFGAWVGARLSPVFRADGTGLVEMVVGGVAFSILSVVGWVMLLRRMWRRPIRRREAPSTGPGGATS